jgi:cation diffusion facilitator CzcD-associated flavoprotein CzcO
MTVLDLPSDRIPVPDSAGDPRPVRRTRYLIVGSGFAGLGMAIRLRQAGERDFVVLERAADVGGTWRDNTYPGCMCDVPSFLYSFSFAQNPDWSCTYPKQAEIWDYLRRCADRFEVRQHIRFNHTLTGADWDAGRMRWVVRSSGGDFEAQFLVLAVGALSEPKIPAIPGLDRFSGTVFHSAQWRHDHDLTGERVAVVGTGASAIQFVPEIQPKVANLYLLQRTPAWVMPHPNRELTAAERAAAERLPFLLRLRRAGVYALREAVVLGLTVDTRIMRLGERTALRHLRSQISDPVLRDKVTPRFRLGCKRIMISNDYYPALTRPNVEVIPQGIREVREHSVVAADGTERTVDTIIFGTGFQVTEFPIARMVRTNGTTLSDTWRGSPQAYAGTTVAGFPNLFLMTGPNTGLGHTSVVYMIESQIRYVLECTRAVLRSGAAALEVKPEAQRRYNDSVQRRMRRTVWTTGGCASWYIDAQGRNSTLWPSFTFRYRARTAKFDAAAYTLHRQPVRPATAA